jgi:hypothetical protein
MRTGVTGTDGIGTGVARTVNCLGHVRTSVAQVGAMGTAHCGAAVTVASATTSAVAVLFIMIWLLRI